MKITKEQAQEMIKKMGCVEVTIDEYHELNKEGEGNIWYDNGSLNYKQKEVYPKVFELRDNYKLEVLKNGTILLRDESHTCLTLVDNIKDRKQVIRAVEESKRITESK